GETVDVNLGGGLRARVPLVLDVRDGHTVGDDPRFARWRLALPRAAPRGGFDPIAGAGDVIVIWNVLEHFWPYWDDVHRDWDRELDVVLAEALADRTADDHLATLRTLSAALPDGHATVRCPGTTPSAELPFDLEQIDGRIVVVASRDPRFEPGDVLGSIDG